MSSPGSPTATTTTTTPAQGRRWFGLRQGELPPVAVLFLWYMCVIGAAFVGRAVRDSLFLARLGADKLPYMYIASPLVTTLVGLAYARIQGKVRRDRLVIGCAAGSGVFILAARFLLGTGDWIYHALYIFVNVMSSVVIVQLWTVAGDRFKPLRDAKRLFGLIGAGGTTADVLIGAAISALAGPSSAPRTSSISALACSSPPPASRWSCAACRAGGSIRRGARSRAPGPAASSACRERRTSSSSARRLSSRSPW